MAIWFTADTHFGWPRINMNLRKFSSDNEASQLFLENINARVKRDDRLWILGDFAENPGLFRKQIRCKDVRLILGNHDKLSACSHCFKFIYEQRLIDFMDHQVFLSHYPCIYWDQSHNGSFHFYGHLHSAREKFLDDLFPDRRSIDVGVDNAFRLLGEWRPFKKDELYDILKERKGHDPVDFYKRFRGEI